MVGGDVSQARPVLSGRYEIEGKLGEGGMASVFKGTDQLLSRTVAIKVLAPRFAHDQTFVERFRREAQAAARLNHPNVVGVFDTGSDNNIHYIVMEYVQGRTLEEALRTEGRILPERAVEIVESVATALSFAHREGLVHRDIKPANIMLTPSGEVKVMDFGIARLTSTETLTQTATVLGTASYLSPEQAQGEAVDARSDIYSLGIVLYEMLTGQVPFTGDTAVAVAYKHVREDPVLPTRIEPRIPSVLEAVVMKALAKNPDNRYPSAEEFRRDLERVRLGQPVGATPVLPPEPTQVVTREARATTVLPAQPVGERERRSRRWLAITLVTLIILAGLGAVAYFLISNLLDDEEPGVQPIEVPSVVGLPEEVATQQIVAAGLEVGEIRRQASPRFPEGDVIRQDPAAQEEVDPGTEVFLLVSTGPRLVEVPEIIGLTEEEARIALEELDLLLGFRAEESSDEFEAGRIIRQNPEPGAMIEQGEDVDYTVSTGGEQVQVPPVVCLTFDGAADLLDQFDLQIEIVDDPQLNENCPDPDRVALQDPPPGARVDQGSVVRVFPALPPPSPTEPSPSPTGTPTGDG
jgi:eukaryotic-like serine/threonine-protein kinase